MIMCRKGKKTAKDKKKTAFLINQTSGRTVETEEKPVLRLNRQWPIRGQAECEFGPAAAHPFYQVVKGDAPTQERGLLLG